MSGPTAAQTNLQQSQADFYKQATSEATTTFGEDQGLLKQMTDVYSPILAKGPNQHGFSAGQTEDLNAQVEEGTAENYKGAAKAVNESLAARGGGNIPITSGGEEEMRANVANAAAEEESNQESQVKQADYSQGYNEWEQAGQGLGAVSGQLNPTGYSGAATNAGNAEGTTADTIQQEDNSWENAAIGAAGAIGGAAVGKIKF